MHAERVRNALGRRRLCVQPLRTCAILLPRQCPANPRSKQAVSSGTAGRIAYMATPLRDAVYVLTHIKKNLWLHA